MALVRPRRVPLDVNHALGMLHQALDVGTVVAVHRDASPARDEAHDVIAHNGIAAARQVGEEIGVPLDHDATGTATSALVRADICRRRHEGLVLGDGLLLGVSQPRSALALFLPLGRSLQTACGLNAVQSESVMLFQDTYYRYIKSFRKSWKENIKEFCIRFLRKGKGKNSLIGIKI